MLSTDEIIQKAAKAGLMIPAFNIRHLPMVEPVIRAVKDCDSFSLIEVARLEWEKFGAGGPRQVYEEFIRYADSRHVRLHLDHIPVIDEDGKRVDYLHIIREAIELGYGSVMVDGSRLPLEENIAATREVVQLTRKAKIACEAELGAIFGHEKGPLPPYEDLFSSGKGFTDIDEAELFVRETGCSWLSVAAGNIHGAISGPALELKKVEARLNFEHIRNIRQKVDIPLVIHGGSRIRKEYLQEAGRLGMAKINVGMEIAQSYESALSEDGNVESAQEELYHRIMELISDRFGLFGIQKQLS